MVFIFKEFAMLDVKTEERHAHEHEILLGKYENGNLRNYDYIYVLQMAFPSTFL